MWLYTVGKDAQSRLDDQQQACMCCRTALAALLARITKPALLVYMMLDHHFWQVTVSGHRTPQEQLNSKQQIHPVTV